MVRGGKSVAGLILAAGASTRMGKPKQLLPAGDQTLLERILDEAPEFKEMFQRNAKKHADLVADLLLKNLIL